MWSFIANAQDPASGLPRTDNAKKANARPADASPAKPEPFDGASVEKMAASCVSLETELGVIEIEMIPEVAPESVRGFLNLAATGALAACALFEKKISFSGRRVGVVLSGGNVDL